MKHQPIRSGLLLALSAVLLLAVGAAWAGDKPACKDAKITLEVDDDTLTFRHGRDGDEDVTMIDLGEIGEIVDEAMEGVSEALAELDEMQLEVHLGQDNLVRFEHDDQEWEVDLGLIAHEVTEALHVALADLDLDDHRHQIHVRGDEKAEIADLEEELDALRKELRSLRKELKRSIDD